MQEGGGEALKTTYWSPELGPQSPSEAAEGWSAWRGEGARAGRLSPNSISTQEMEEDGHEDSKDMRG